MKVLYVRSGPYSINFNNYNLQEVGLGKAFCRAGYDFDIVYYSKQNKDQIVEVPEGNLRIFWRRGIKILRTGLYPKVWNKKFLLQYDAVITSEYSQLMSVIISKRHDNAYIYNGPYYNLFKIPFIEPVYDYLYCKQLNKRVKKVFCKTQMSKEYITKKGITDSLVVGVGLDTAKFDAETEIGTETQKLLDVMKGHRNFLYVGSIIKRKNVELIIRAFVKLKKENDNEDVQLILIGKGDDSYTNYCKSLIPKIFENTVEWCSFIKNAQMKFVYQKATVFLLPSIQEIFGMVLLEAMYFGKPIISSKSAGAETLIKSGENGIIIDTFDEKQWKEAMKNSLNNPERADYLGKRARETILSQFMWDGVARKMIDCMKRNDIQC